MIFIFGGKGFVGSAFVRYCEKNNLKYEIIHRDNYNEFKAKNCDIFINAAGNSKKNLSNQNPQFDFQSNVSEVLTSFTDFKFKKYILLSSCEVYPDYSNLEFTTEKTFIEVKNQSVYGFHKYLGELCVQRNLDDWLIFRLGGMVGEGLKKNPIFDILNGGPLFVDPNSKFQFILTDDVAKIIFQVIKKDIRNELYNLCGDGGITLSDIIKNTDEIIVKPNSPLLHYNVNIEKIKKISNILSSKSTIQNFIHQNSFD